MRATHVVRRLLMAVPLAIGILLLSFLLLRLMPGDPVDIAMGSAGNVTDQEIDALQKALDLDKPLATQLLLFTGRLARGDLGDSIVDRRPVRELLLEALPATVELALAALLVAVLLALPIGVLSAVRARSLFDRLAMTGSFFGISMPPFWLGLILIMLFGVSLGWLPTHGRLEPGILVPRVTGFMTVDALLAGRFDAFLSSLRHLLLPALTLGAELTAILSRVIRSGMVEVLQQEYVRTARAKGARESRVVIRHALRNALIPTVTVLGLQFGVLMGGNMIVETIFSWPGLGRLVVGSIFARDYPVVQGAVLLYALMFLAANLAVDMLYTLLNPKITT